ncbi:hypothetical protein CcCBS67573_g00692 [Chytriomyces confervae]|uniref:alpha-1,6-mannosyl-glycoprotein 6-beta-N-acetylglucosaminyltransferase n=1 Tax=Chytriomyces confervae TaxID=246404 RepID=A0A507FQR4_9FUNG|nr:hypothetical protein CcCBS67573_g00692 [Chytriomyces confervae]
MTLTKYAQISPYMFQLVCTLVFAFAVVAATLFSMDQWIISDFPSFRININVTQIIESFQNLRQNDQKLTKFIDCINFKNCSQAQMNVLILASPNFGETIRGHISGENIWARSVMHSLDLLGYTYFIADNQQEALALHKVVGNYTRMVILSEADLGSEWQLSPENYKATKPFTRLTYLGYSLEHWCRQTPYIHSREHRVYILAKHAGHVGTSAINMTLIQDLSSEGIEFVMGGGNAGEFVWPNVTNFGVLSKEQFHIELSKSRVLLGLGNPTTSPSPYDAMCLGVPFVNPIVGYDKERPWDRSRWELQQPFLAYMEEPYVYNVHADNRSAVIDAVRRAMKAPLFERKVLSHMTTAAMKDRVEKIVLLDWRSKALEVQKMNMEYGGNQVFIE